ncbi:MAG: tRNA preQ1(34) S-adenosylmethionine ribosyltransferase-isomerase QueA [Candidatus Poribacteria bacterium]|nr:tRNA preQ1(34) S-adenosylmethionine ribosyltransferase-isomerase QueA [Candidatus Poribacteria bacterium]MDE0503668.1 tRNA preQ1(34) S-adenosylmethionine ribosyltransferase-isomerase QueA [Candidatus Poribacteria bacterium]
MKLADFDYQLPEHLIAQSPVLRRDTSRLMVIDRCTRVFRHAQFSQIDEFLPKGALLTLNDTKVIPARLIGNKPLSGGRVELLLAQQKGNNIWEVLAKPGKSVLPGTRIEFGGGVLRAQVIALTKSGSRIVRFEHNGDFHEILANVGQVPLPPYIKRDPKPADKNRYQCVYATSEGAIAAPTAGLHFTEPLMVRMKRTGFKFVTLTLHVGLGTFQPVKVRNVERHKMHSEHLELSQAAAATINAAKEDGNKIVAVGTTSVRALETAASGGGITPYIGDTGIFIYPGYQFKLVDALITNFHLPKSTLLMLVSAFAGRELILKAYREAIKRNYRFYSYGDAMLIL